MALAEQRQLALTIRHPKPDEIIPLPFGLWEPGLPFAYDTDWIWSAYSEGGVLYAIFIASPMHGFVHLVKAHAAPDAPKGWLRSLLRTAIDECADRGYKGFFMVTDGHGIEGKMVRLIERQAKRLNATIVPFSGYSVAGLLMKGMI